MGTYIVKERFHINFLALEKQGSILVKISGSADRDSTSNIHSALYVA